jgi:hypothetical protein
VCDIFGSYTDQCLSCGTLLQLHFSFGGLYRETCVHVPVYRACKHKASCSCPAQGVVLRCQVQHFLGLVYLVIIPAVYL